MRLILIIVLVISWCTLQAQVAFNGNFENLTGKGKPEGWDMAFNTKPSYKIQLDSVVKRQGKYSVSIAYDTGRVNFGAINYPIKKPFVGKTLILVGTLKTEKVEGSASLFLAINGPDGQINQVDMRDQKLSGTNDWKEFYIQLPYDEGDVLSLDAGAYLAGRGKIWIDSLRLYLDEVPINLAPVASFKATNDTAFRNGSGIDTIITSKKKTTYLTLLGKLWGFLKYHHPAIAKGDYNWDNELFRILPAYLKCTTDAQVSALLEQWVDSLGKPQHCLTCKPWTAEKNIAVEPDYGGLFSNAVFNKSLNAKLRYILANHDSTYNYYVSLPFIPTFTHEKPYKKLYPDVGYRLLALYRYWNIIQYFCPNRELVTEGWNNMLPKFIPLFISARNQTAYALTVNKLIVHLHDGHAFIESQEIDRYQGSYRLPVAAHFIEGKLVVTGYYKDTLDVKQKFKVGDIIADINGKSVQDFMKQYLPLMSSSNYDSQLRDLPGNYLLKSDNKQFLITLLRNNQPYRISAAAAETSKINGYDFNQSPHAKSPGYYLINKDIGYLFPAMYSNKNLEDMKKTFKYTKGIIVDMRCYPGDEMEQTFGNYIKPLETAYVKFSHGSLRHPGLFTFSEPSKNGKKSDTSYTGKVIVIINALTQSNAEFVTMAFQSAPNVTVIGSTSAGADGNVTPIVLPGRFSTHISGIGVYYPDGTNTQRSGVKIDYVIRPTIKGIRENRDEVLERAKELINVN
jgi:C-terminal processing protease CtpA/Prc